MSVKTCHFNSQRTRRRKNSSNALASKTPVREALAWLETDGLVETEVFKGAVVSSYSLRDLEEIYELGLLLEVQAARKAAESMDDDVRGRLVNIS